MGKRSVSNIKSRIVIQLLLMLIRAGMFTEVKGLSKKVQALQFSKGSINQQL